MNRTRILELVRNLHDVLIDIEVMVQMADQGKDADSGWSESADDLVSYSDALDKELKGDAFEKFMEGKHV